MQRPAYPSDLTDAQWSLIERFMPDHKRLGRNREVNLREVVNAIFFINRAGCQWDMLPHDFPNFKTVNWYYNEWRRSGLWEVMMNALRDAVRQAADRNETPTVACIDSQTAKTVDQGGDVGLAVLSTEDHQVTFPCVDTSVGASLLLNVLNM